MEIHQITDFNAPELDIYARLTENQLVNRAAPENALFVAESPLVIGRALDAGCEPVSFLMEQKHIEGKGAALLARCPDVPVYAAELDVLTQLTGFHLTRGMLCAMRRPKPRDPAVLLQGASRVAVLENVMNPTNLGAIFRSAAALGMDAVLLTNAGSDPLYRRAVRVSMGTVFQIPWAYLPEDWPTLLHALGFCTAASTPEGQEFGYVFMKCRFQGEGIPDGAIYLGRPWREFAKTVLLHCELGAHIRPEGWHDWNKPCFPATGYYAEFASTGAGSQGQRAAYVHQLTAEEAEKYTFERFWASISPEG